MSKDFSYLRHWITGEGYPKDCPPRPVILECIPSRSGMSMAVYDRGERIFTVNGCGFDRIGTALGMFLEAQFQPELKLAFPKGEPYGCTSAFDTSIPGCFVNADGSMWIDGGYGFSSMQGVAEAINLKVTRSESKAGTLLVIEKGN